MAKKYRRAVISSIVLDLLIFTCLLGCAVSAVAETNFSPARHVLEHSRNLQQSAAANNDFAGLNRILKDAVFRLGSVQVAEGLLLNLALDEIRCGKVSVEDVQFRSVQTLPNAVNLYMTIRGLDLSCTMQYSYRTLFFRGTNRDATVTSIGNTASVTMVVQTDGATLSQRPPIKASVSSCTAALQVTDLNLQGTVLGLAPVESVVSRLIQRQASQAACDYLSSTSALQTFLRSVQRTVFTPYPADYVHPPLSALETNVLQGLLPSVMLETSTTPWLQFQASDNTTKSTRWGQLLDMIMREGTEFFTSTTSDSNELRVNTLLRDHVLDDQGALTIERDAVVWTAMDRITSTSVSFQNLELVGLDSILHLEPFRPAAPHSLQTSITWQDLEFRVQAQVEMKPSTASNSVMVGANKGDGITENITLRGKLGNLAATVAVTAALDDLTLRTMTMGSVLRKPLPCMLSALEGLHISSVSVAVLDEDALQNPILEGFLDTGMDRLVNSAVQAAMRMYKPLLVRSLPAVFQIAVRKALNTALETWRHETRRDTFCEHNVVIGTSQQQKRSMDWRDLLLDPSNAMAAGATGTEPYGSVISYLRRQLQTRLLDIATTTATPKLNQALLRPLTQAQSGTEGMLLLPNSINYTFSPFRSDLMGNLLRNVSLSAGAFTLRNLDSVVAPLELLTVVDDHVLLNHVQWGNTTTANTSSVAFKSLQLSGSIRVTVQADNPLSPLALDNLLEVTLSVQPALDLHAKLVLDEGAVLSFPLKDMMSADCWAATLLAADLETWQVDLAAMHVNVRCISCTSGGGWILPELLGEMNKMGLVRGLAKLISVSLQEIGAGYWDALNIFPDQIALASARCPHNTAFRETSPSQQWPSLPSLPMNAIKTLGYSVTMALQVWMITTARGHELMVPNALETEPLTKADQDEKQSAFLDWNNLGDTIGGWADPALQRLQEASSAEVIDELTGKQSLAINSAMTKLLDSNGDFVVKGMSGMRLAFVGSEVVVDQLRIGGLDSFIHFDPLLVKASQSIETTMTLETVSLELDISFNAPSDHNTTLTFGLDGVDLKVATILNVVWEELSHVEIGSLLEVKKILPCVVSNIHNIWLLNLDISAHAVSSPELSYILMSEDDISRSEMANMFFRNHESTFLRSLPLLANTTLRRSVNEVLSGFMGNQELYCQISENLKSSSVIDFRDLLLPADIAKEYGGSGVAPYGDTAPLLYELLQGQLSSQRVGEESMLNQLLVNPLTSSQSNVNGSVLVSDVARTSGHASISNWKFRYKLSISNLFVQNLDSIRSPISVLQPVKENPSMLSSSVSIGADNKPLRLSMDIHLGLDDDQSTSLSNNITVSLELNFVTVLLSIAVGISESALFRLPVRDMKDIDCWLATIDMASLTSSTTPLLNYSLTADYARLNITCISCSTPKFSELAHRLYNPGDTKREIQSFIDQTKNTIDSFIGSDFFQNLLVEVVSDAKSVCPNSDGYDPDAPKQNPWTKPQRYFGVGERDSRMRVFTIVNTIIAALLLIGVVWAKFVIRRRESYGKRGITDGEGALLDWQDRHTVPKQEYVDSGTNSLFLSDVLQRRVRYAVPAVILLNVCLYIYAHTALLSYLNVEADFAGERISIKQFLEFAFFEAAIRTYRAGGNEMALMLIVFSGMWPYLKLVTALALWFLPPQRLRASRRGTLFLWMDVLSRLSVIDIAMTLVAIGVFLVYIGGPGRNFYEPEGDLYSMTLVAVPRGGFYCMLIAQRLNRLGSRFFLDCHNKVISSALEEHCGQMGTADWDDQYDQTKHTTLASPSTSSLTTLPNDTLSRGHWCVSGIRRMGDYLRSDLSKNDDQEGTWLSCFKAQTAGAIALFLGGICAFLLFIIGCVYAPSISINVEEVLGMALESGQSLDVTVRDFNVFRVMCLILLKCRFVLNETADYVGLGILLGLAVFAAFISPAIQGINKIVAWARTPKPLRLTFWKSLDVQPRRSGNSAEWKTSLTSRAGAWDNVEVYVIAFCLANWQLGAVAAYVIHNYCQLLETAYRSLSSVGIVDAKHTSNCFRTQASSPLTVTIIVASFLFLLVSFLFQITAQYRENIDRIKNSLSNQSDEVESNASPMSTVPPEVNNADVAETSMRAWGTEENCSVPGDVTNAICSDTHIDTEMLTPSTSAFYDHPCDVDMELNAESLPCRQQHVSPLDYAPYMPEEDTPAVAPVCSIVGDTVGSVVNDASTAPAADTEQQEPAHGSFGETLLPLDTDIPIVPHVAPGCKSTLGIYGEIRGFLRNEGRKDL